MKTLIREALPEDAGQIVEYTKVVGGETDNLTYGKQVYRLLSNRRKNSLEIFMKIKHPCS
ncbi:MAG: hypothetical protein LUC32_01590 [Clostridiales bacterium]|nr:hypothetical protein [Clostridiales bacterium]